MAVSDKLTRQQRTIREYLNGAREFKSAQEIHSALRAGGAAVGLATVYRGLQVLVDNGTVDVLRADDGEARYRACRADHHHHHLVCRSCSRTVEVEFAAVEAWAEQVGAAHGFRAITHHLELFGLCSSCDQTAGPASDH